MRNRQTCTIGHLNLILPSIALVEVETLSITCQVISRTGVHDQVGFLSGGRCGVAGAVVVVGEVATVRRLMPPVLANLALGAPAPVVAIAASVSSSIAAVAAIAVGARLAALALALVVADLPRLGAATSGTATSRAARVMRACRIGVVDRPRRDVGGGCPVLDLRLLLI